MSVMATEQMSRAAKSKMLAGNVASATLTATTTVKETNTTKLSNQDNHNEHVAASVDEMHLSHAMLGNFNQQNELWHAKLESDNNNSNNNKQEKVTNICCGMAWCAQRKRQQILRLNGNMNYDVNNMQQATITKSTVDSKLSDGSNERIFNDNTSSRRCDIHLKPNDEQHNDNKETLNSYFQLPSVCRTPTKTVDAATTVHALSVAKISTRETPLPEVHSGPEAIATICLQHSTPSTLKPTPTALTDIAAESLLRTTSANVISNSHCGTNRKLDNNTAVGPKAKKFGVAVRRLPHKRTNSGGGIKRKRRRRRRNRRNCALRHRSHFKSSSSTTEIAIQSAKINAAAAAIKNVATKSSFANARALNSSALTSFILNSTLLALCNATAATALSAMAATLSESISNTAGSAATPLVVANEWRSGMENISFTIAANGSNDAVGELNMAAGAGAHDISFNDSDNLLEVEDREYIFDRRDVRIIFITLYTLVFCCCVFGNLLVILVVTLSRRLRSITNFFLANLAVADLCVGLFCVLQNLSIYLIESWVFGEFLCRMYQFVHSLSYTASIFILVVICMERYFAIVHPITCKQILTAARLRMVILTVWVTSAVYSTPKFVFSKTIKNIHTGDGQEEEICVLDRKMYNSKLLDMINFGLLYVIPLLVMTVLYSKIAIALWRSSHGLSHHLVTHHEQQQQQQQQDESISLHNSMYHHQQQPQQPQHLPHNHNHNHHHHQHHNHYHHHHQVPQNHHSLQAVTTPTTHTINHQHNHLQQTSATQQLPCGAALTSQHVVGVVGMAGTGGSGVGVGVVLCGGTSQTSGLLSRKQSSKYEKRGLSITESQVSLDSERPIVSACRNGGNNNGNNSGGSIKSNHKSSFIQHHHHSSTHPHPHPQRPRVTHMSHSSNNVLRARRGVVRMLIIFVLTFALCNLPYHARKMWQYWSRSYRGDSNFNALLTPLTFLVTYFNSGINPLLYAFLSRNFRKGMKELLLCSWKKGKGKSSSNSSMHHKRVALQTHSLPTDTTHIGNEQL